MKEFINFNGEILDKKDFSLDLSNRAFRFGDSIFETIRVFNGVVVFIDDHYSRLKSTLEIVKIRLPEYFTKEYLHSEIIKTLHSQSTSLNARVRLTIFRKESSSIYFVDSRDSFDFVIELVPLNYSNFDNHIDDYEIDIFEDIKKSKGILSQIKSNNVLLHSIAGSVVTEKSINNIVLVNEDECLTEAVNANVFIVEGNTISTPKLSDGCVDGVMRKSVIKIIKEQTDFNIEIRSIDKNELFSSEEIFLTNSIIGVQSVDKYRTNSYSKVVSSVIREKLIGNINSLMDQQGS